MIESKEDNGLPISRIKTIMRSSPEIQNISNDSLYSVSKSTELFISYIAKLMYSKSPNKDSLTYNDLANVVGDEDSLLFLEDTIPKKITVAEYYTILGKRKRKLNNSSDE